MSPVSPRAETAAGGRPRVAYLGPEGTFSEEALLAGARPDSVQPVAVATIFGAIASLRGGDVEFALVPIENSLEGSVSITLDLLAGEQGRLQIAGETVLAVRHSLISASDTPLPAIDTVWTHPQVPGQCVRFLHGELARARVLAATSTAEAVRAVIARARTNEAALGTSLAARVYGGTVLRENVQDSEDNQTRFAWLARAGEPPSRPPLRETGEASEWRTSLVFWGAGANSPGWLVRCLGEFGSRAINLTKIESRPQRGRIGDYMFFADLQGRAEDARVAQALAGLETICEAVHVLGSYPAGRALSGAGVDGAGARRAGDRAERQTASNRHDEAMPSLHSGPTDG